MRLSLFAFCTAALLATAELHAQEAPEERAAELSLSDDTAELRYISPTDLGGQEGSLLSYAVFLSEDRDVVGSVAALFGTELDFAGLEIKLGPQAYAALLNEENNDVFTLAFGLQARYDLIPSRGIAIAAHAFYAPDILTFGSADNLSDLMARGEIRVTDRIVAFAGYRWFKLDLLEREDLDLQNQMFAGVQYQLR